MALVFDDIKDEFLEAVQQDLLAARYARENTYRAATRYAGRVGNALANVFRRHAPVLSIEEWDLENLIPQALGLDHSMVAEMCLKVQTAMNEAAGLGIRAAEPKFDGNRAYGIVEELRAHPEFTDIEKLFYDQVANFSMHVVDESVRANADVQSNAGLDVSIVRTADADACIWCREVAGVYPYEEVKNTGNDVFRRHDSCNCTCDFVSRRGSQDVWSKQWRN